MLERYLDGWAEIYGQEAIDLAVEKLGVSFIAELFFSGVNLQPYFRRMAKIAFKRQAERVLRKCVRKEGEE